MQRFANLPPLRFVAFAKGTKAPQTDISPVARTRPKGFRQAAFLECAGAGSRFQNGAHGHSSTLNLPALLSFR